MVAVDAALVARDPVRDRLGHERTHCGRDRQALRDRVSLDDRPRLAVDLDVRRRVRRPLLARVETAGLQTLLQTTQRRLGPLRTALGHAGILRRRLKHSQRFVPLLREPSRLLHAVCPFPQLLGREGLAVATASTAATAVGAGRTNGKCVLVIRVVGHREAMNLRGGGLSSRTARPPGTCPLWG